MKPFLTRYGDFVLAGSLGAIFTLWPQLDLEIAGLFHEPGVGFPISEWSWIRVLHLAIAKFWIAALVLLFLLLLGVAGRFKTKWAGRRRMLLYLLAVLLAGPGLTVDLMKNHWGRARPRAIMEFGGLAEFTPALLPARHCRRNCSFVSGHAGAGFYPMAVFWVRRRRRWLVAGVLLGLFFGGMRMAVGAHFLSDVLFAGLIVHFTSRSLAALFRLSARTREDAADMPAPELAHSAK